MKNLSKIITAVGVGIAAGAIAGLLFAPDKGEETRRKIAKKSNKMMKSIGADLKKEKLMQIKEKIERKLQHMMEKENARKEEPTVV